METPRLLEELVEAVFDAPTTEKANAKKEVKQEAKEANAKPKEKPKTEKPKEQPENKKTFPLALKAVLEKPSVLETLKTIARLKGQLGALIGLLGRNKILPKLFYGVEQALSGADALDNKLRKAIKSQKTENCKFSATEKIAEILDNFLLVI